MSGKYTKKLTLGELNRIPDALEGAFILLLAQNAILFSRPITEIIRGAQLQMLHVIVITVSLVNFFTIGANWIESRHVEQKSSGYTRIHLYWDIAILATFFMLGQLLSAYLDDDFTAPKSVFIATIGVMYFLLNIFFITWNNIEIRNRRKDKDFAKSMGHVNRLNIYSSFFAFMMLAIPIITPETVFHDGAYLIWLFNWGIIIIYYTTQNALRGEIDPNA